MIFAVRKGVKAYKNHQQKKAMEEADAAGNPDYTSPLAQDNTQFAQGQGQPRYHSAMAQQGQYRDNAPQNQYYSQQQQSGDYKADTYQANNQQASLAPVVDSRRRSHDSRRSSNAGSEDERIAQAQAHAAQYGDAPAPDYQQNKMSHNPFQNSLEKHGMKGPQ